MRTQIGTPGCTGIPLLVGETELGVLLSGTTTIHARAALKHAWKTE
jgi:aspartate/glutamate racemase